MTLVEVGVAMGIAGFMCMGLHSLGLGVVRTSHRLRVEVEAQAFAKDGLENIVFLGLDDIQKPNCSAVETVTRVSTTGVDMTRSVQIIWRDASGAVVGVNDPKDYAEVHVTVSFSAFGAVIPAVYTYSTLVE